MANATFNIYRKPIPVIIEKTRNAVAKLILNVLVYATPNPPTAGITIQINALETSYNDALQGGKDKKKLMQINKQKLLVMMAILLAYIQTTSAGDPVKILLVAELKGDRKPAGLLPPPGNVRADFGAHIGEIILLWAGVPKRKVYYIQYNATPADDKGWIDLAGGITSKIKFSVTGLISGQIYAFRIATISADGLGGFSAAINHMAF